MVAMGSNRENYQKDEFMFSTILSLEGGRQQSNHHYILDEIKDNAINHGSKVYII